MGFAANMASAVPGIGQGVAAAKLAGGAAGLYGGYRAFKWAKNGGGKRWLWQKESWRKIKSKRMASLKSRPWHSKGFLQKGGDYSFEHIISRNGKMAKSFRIPTPFLNGKLNSGLRIKSSFNNGFLNRPLGRASFYTGVGAGFVGSVYGGYRGGSYLDSKMKNQKNDEK